MKPQTKKLYLDASKIALDNAVDIFVEAEILYARNAFARSFALGILSAEEIAKSYIYRSISANLLDPSPTRLITIKHEEKILHFKQLLSFIITISDYHEEISKAMEHDHDKPHSEHVFADVLIKIVSDTMSIIDETFLNAHDVKLDSIYVDVRENRIVEPKEVITKQKCVELLTIINKALQVSRSTIKTNDKAFTDLTKTFFISIKRLAISQGKEF